MHRIADRRNTPEERLAAVAANLRESFLARYSHERSGPTEPDYADFRDALRPYVQQELLFARIDERRKMCGDVVSSRMEVLQRELLEVQQQIPEEHRL